MKRQDTVIVLQARYGSSRLPGKTLRRICGTTLLAQCLERLLASGVAPVVLATTRLPEDDALVVEADRLGVRSLRGATHDVLGRFAMVADVLRPRWIVRATGDNPLVDIDAPRRVLQTIAALDADYVGERGLPLGAAVEAVRTTALLDAHEAALEPYDREHVTPFIRRSTSRYRVEERDAPRGLRRPDLRLTVDTPDDLARVRRLVIHAGAPRMLPLAAVIDAADRLVAAEAA